MKFVQKGGRLLRVRPLYSVGAQYSSRVMPVLKEWLYQWEASLGGEIVALGAEMEMPNGELRLYPLTAEDVAEAEGEDDA